MNMPCPWRSSRGFTLVELVYAIIIVGILAAVLIPVALNSLRAYETTRQQVAVLDRTRYAMERMVREIREIRFNATQEAQLSTATATQIVFSRRGVTGGAASDVVTLARNGTTLTLAYASMPTTGAQLLLASVSALNLVYLDKAQAPITMSVPPAVTELARVYAIRIELSVSTPEGQTLSRRTVVQLKNRELL